jgi:formamidopyrimidine-DNA glycosylase
MVELPELEVITRDLVKEVAQSTVVRLDILSPFCRVLKDQNLDSFRGEIFRIIRSGSIVVIELDSPFALTVEFSPVAHFDLRSDDSTVGAGYTREEVGDQFSITLDFDARLVFNDPANTSIVKVIPTSWIPAETTRIDTLNLSREDFVHLIYKKKRSILISVLTDPELFEATPGEYYANEICAYSKINPMTRVANLSGQALLDVFNAFHSVLHRAIDLGGSSIGSMVRVNRKNRSDYVSEARLRPDGSCGTCNGKLVRKIISNKTALYCSVCQPV